MRAIPRRVLLGGSVTGVGLAFLYMAVHQLQIGVRNFREFSFCVAGLLGLVCASAFGLVGLCGVMLGLALLYRARR